MVISGRISEIYNLCSILAGFILENQNILRLYVTVDDILEEGPSSAGGFSTFVL